MLDVFDESFDIKKLVYLLLNIYLIIFFVCTNKPNSRQQAKK